VWRITDSNANTHADTNPDSDANANTNTNTYADSYAGAKRSEQPDGDGCFHNSDKPIVD